MQGIYMYTNPITHKIYIGKAQNLDVRHKAHLRNHKNPKHTSYNSHFYTDARELANGFNDLIYEILESSETWTEDDLNQKEIYYIALYDATNEEIGYNIQKGGLSTGVPRKLSEVTVMEIKSLLFQSKISQRAIAEKYKVGESLISMINSGQLWSTVGDFSYPIRKTSFDNNKGGNNPRALFTDREIVQIRIEFVKQTLPQLQKKYKDRCSKSEMKKICYGVQFQHLPIYKKREKKWILNGTCIDYPRIEEY